MYIHDNTKIIRKMDHIVQPKTPHPLQILLVKLTFLPQKHIPYCPNHCGIEGGCYSSKGKWPEERGPNLEARNILNLIQRGLFRYLPTSSMKTHPSVS